MDKHDRLRLEIRQEEDYKLSPDLFFGILSYIILFQERETISRLASNNILLKNFFVSIKREEI